MTAVRDTLLQLAEAYRHVHNENKREWSQDHRRRRHEQHMHELAMRFEATLAHWVSDEESRESWRRHLYHDEPAPAYAPESSAPLLFRGRSEAGSKVEVRPGADADYDIWVDGTRSGRLPAGTSLEHGLRLGELQVSEIFELPSEAQQALFTYLDHPDGQQPPWSHAQQLWREGLVDAHFSLTERGRRFATLHRRGAEGHEAFVLR